MRGLSGWLAAHCSEAREFLIARDPLGAALYGNLRDFSTDERSELLRALSRSEALNLLRREVSWIEASSTLGALTAPDMEQVIVDLLSSPSRDPDRKQLVQFVLALIGQGPRRRDLIPTLLAVVRDATWPPEVSELALDAMLHATEEGDDWTGDLMDVLEEIRTGSIADPDHQMRGALLRRLYPRALGPNRVWGYLTKGGNASFIGRYQRFWWHHLISESSDRDVAELLDQLSERLFEAAPALEAQRATLLPYQLLTRGLAACGDDLSPARLYNWLRSAVLSPWQYPDPRDESVLQVHNWLEQRPEVQKAVILEGLDRCRDSKHFRHDLETVWATLLGSKRPPDFGLWSLEQTVALAPAHPRAAEELLDVAYGGYLNHVYDRGLSLDVLVDRVRGHEVLERHFSVLRERVERRDESAALEAARVSRAKDQEASARDEGIAYVRSHAEALRENQAPLALLHDLGRAYFLHETNWADHPPPAERLSELLGGDDGLISAALAGLRGTVWRSEVPSVEEIIRLEQRSRMHYSAFPFLAGLDILEREAPERLEYLNESQVRTGLAFFYCNSPGFNGFPDWHAGLVSRSPEVVADVATRCLVTAIRHGDGYSPALDAINLLGANPDLQRETTLDVLRKFPTRAGLERLKTLDRLLWNALDYRDRSRLLELVESKLALHSMEVSQQAHRLAAGFVAVPAAYTERLQEFVRGRVRRVRALAAFFGSGGSAARLPPPSYEECATALRILIALLGRAFAPAEMSGFVTLEMTASGKIDRLVRRLSSLPGEDALQALDGLVADPELTHWRPLQNSLGAAQSDELHREGCHASANRSAVVRGRLDS